MLSPASSPTPGLEFGGLSGAGVGPVARQVRVLLVAERVDGFFLERLTEGGDVVGATRHDTMDEAMDQAYSEYAAISDWRLCPDDVDPLEYLRA